MPTLRCELVKVAQLVHGSPRLRASPLSLPVDPLHLVAGNREEEAVSIVHFDASHLRGIGLVENVVDGTLD